MKTNNGLVEHVKMALSETWGYVWGTFGLLLTATLFSEKLRQYPDGVGRFKEFIEENWIGKRTADCIGLIKSYIWWNGSDAVYDWHTDVSANGMYNVAKEKGEISTMPDIPGLCVWKDGHIGVYIGNGQVIEAHGTTYGVIQTPLRGLGATLWTHWLQCPFISNEGSVENTDLYKGCAGSLVTNLQTKLNKIGYNLDVDGIFGPQTEAAVKNFESNNNLQDDGIVGKATMQAIDDMLAKLEKPLKGFEDIIHEVSDEDADEWIEKVDSMEKAAEAEGDLGAFEFCKFLKTLIIKTYYHK